MKLNQIFFIWVFFIAILSSCKKDETEEINYDLKTFNFSCDTALVTTDNCFLAVDYKTSSVIKINSSGSLLWKKSNLFVSKEYTKKADEKPYIRSLSNGDFIICEQITDSFKANINQVYTHLILTRFHSDGTLAFQKNQITNTKKKILPFNILENSANELIMIGVNETNEICGVISYFKTDKEGELIANSNKTINTAAYWLNGIFYNARTYMNSLSIASDLYAIIQIGTQTSCFKIDNEGKVLLYKRFNYATEFDIQQQIEASSFWEYTISNFVNINNNELLISGVKYAGQNYTSTKTYLQHTYVVKINTTFDSINCYRDPASNFQYGASPLINADASISSIGYDSEELGGDNFLRVLKLNSDLTLKERKIYSNLLNYKGMAAIANADGSLSVVGNNSAYGSLNRHTFFLKLKLDGSL
jgi:hypothetical protein